MAEIYIQTCIIMFDPHFKINLPLYEVTPDNFNRLLRAAMMISRHTDKTKGVLRANIG